MSLCGKIGLERIEDMGIGAGADEGDCRLDR